MGFTLMLLLNQQYHLVFKGAKLLTFIGYYKSEKMFPFVRIDKKQEKLI